MAKLNNGRKAALVIIGIVTISIAIMSHPQSSTPAAAAPATPAAVAVPVTPAVVAPTAAPVVATPFTKFIVFQENPNHNHYVLSGFMPTGNCLKANDFWTDNCHTGQRCIQIAYDATCSSQDQGWGGMYWLQPANNWGEKQGGYNLTGAQRLVFWARGEHGGEIIESFKVGGIIGAEHKFPDSDTAIMGPVTLTKEWQQYTIDLTGKNLSYIVGGFAWATDAASNPQGATFYLDDIYFE